MAFRMDQSATSGGARGGRSVGGGTARQGKGLTDRLYKLFISLLEVAPYLLIPTTFKYYEVFAEGCHSLSQLLPYITHLIMAGSNDIDSIVGLTKLEYFLRVITKVINCIEVFVEKVAVCFISSDKNMDIVRNDANYTMLIVLIEGLKALCRLLILHDRKKASMLIHWGLGTLSSTDVKDLLHYREFYRVDLHTFRANPSSKMGSKSTESTEETNTTSQETKVYRGSRSGINIPLTNGHGGFSTNQRNFTNSSHNDHDRNNLITNKFPFSAEQLFVLGEILYILRPVVYAWALHYAVRKRNIPQNLENSDEKTSADDTDTPSQGYTTNKKSVEKFIALAISLSIELISIQLTARALQMCRDDVTTGANSNNDSRNRGRKNSHAFDQEVTRRKSNLAYYLIRSPLFDKATLPILKQASSLLVHIPIINALPKYAIDILQYYNRCHFYNSNS